MCAHLVIRKLSDMMYRNFPAFREGYRFYQCNECGQFLKAKEAQAHTVVTTTTEELK